MLIAVTGVAGFLGRYLARAAVQAGHTVRGLVRPGEAAPPHIEAIRGSLEDREAVDRLVRRADVLVHLAAAGVQSRDREWDRTTQVNVVLSLALLESAARAGVGFAVASGTCLEYAGHGRLPDAPWNGTASSPLCDEKSPLGISTVYSVTKAAGGLLMCARARALGMPFSYLRLASMYGPEDDPQKFLPGAINSARYRQPYRMTAGCQVREWLHVEDAARAFMAALDQPSSFDGVANVGTGTGVALRDLVCRVFDLLEADRDLIRLGADPYRPDEVHVLVMDSLRFRTQARWDPVVSLDEGLAGCVRG